MSSNSKSSNSISFCGLLAIVFIVLKLCSVIDWSWWWVLAPLWIPIAFCLAALILLLLVYAFKH